MSSAALEGLGLTIITVIGALFVTCVTYFIFECFEHTRLKLIRKAREGAEADASISTTPWREHSTLETTVQKPAKTLSAGTTREARTLWRTTPRVTDPEPSELVQMDAQEEPQPVENSTAVPDPRVSSSGSPREEERGDAGSFPDDEEASGSQEEIEADYVEVIEPWWVVLREHLSRDTSIAHYAGRAHPDPLRSNPSNLPVLNGKDGARGDEDPSWESPDTFNSRDGSIESNWEHVAREGAPARKQSPVKTSGQPRE